MVRYKGQLYFTEDESPPDPQPLAGSFIEFFINGASQGRTYVDAIKEGTYYPALSIYTHARQLEPARVQVNFGETSFAFPPPQQLNNSGPGPWAKPACDLPHAAPVDTS